MYIIEAWEGKVCGPGSLLYLDLGPKRKESSKVDSINGETSKARIPTVAAAPATAAGTPWD